VSEERDWREGETKIMPPRVTTRSDVAVAFVVVLALNVVWAAAIVAVVFATR